MLENSRQKWECYLQSVLTNSSLGNSIRVYIIISLQSSFRKVGLFILLKKINIQCQGKANYVLRTNYVNSGLEIKVSLSSSFSPFPVFSLRVPSLVVAQTTPPMEKKRDLAADVRIWRLPEVGRKIFWQRRGD